MTHWYAFMIYSIINQNIHTHIFLFSFFSVFLYSSSPSPFSSSSSFIPPKQVRKIEKCTSVQYKTSGGSYFPTLHCKPLEMAMDEDGPVTFQAQEMWRKSREGSCAVVRRHAECIVYFTQSAPTHSLMSL